MITREQAHAISDLKAGYTLGNADVAILNDLARIALASLEAEVVGEVVLGEYDDSGCHPDARVVCIAADGQADWENFKDGTRLYATPPAPVSVPDAISTRQAIAKMENHEPCDSINVAYKFGWNACRAAMLQGQPVSNRDELPYDQQIAEYEKIMQQATPDGWILVPEEPTKEMIDAGWLHFMGSKNPSSKGTYKAMLAAAPQQEMLGGR